MGKINISILPLLLLTVCSCDFLTTETIGKSTIKTYFSDISSLEPAMNGVYHLTYSFYSSYFIPYSEIAADEWTLSASEGGIWLDYQDYMSTAEYETSAVGYIWKNGYNIINNANEIIYYAPKLKDDNPGYDDLIDNVTASAFFMRALVHHALCLTYGQNYTYTSDASHLGVPVRDNIPGLNDAIARKSVREVYSQIISDLETALNTFSNCSSSAEYATPLACKALLARIYLYMNNWDKAVEYASEVISAKPLTSRDNYEKMYCDPNYIADEVIFRLNGFDQSSNLYSMAYYESPTIRPAGKVTSLFTDERDIRGKMFSMTAGDKEYENVVLKYAVTSEVESDEYRFVSPIILRTSEMYLIRAEANCCLGNLPDAARDVRTLEARALGIDEDDVAIEYAGKDELYAIVNEERQKEMCFEGMRLFDITRRHKDLVRDGTTTSSVASVTYPDLRFVLQIPYVEMEVNDYMVQNPYPNE